jgi:hypothetical protein
MIPDHPSGQVAEKVCISLIDDYYLKLSTENVFGIIPWILSENEMNTGQQVDGIYYKYFLHVGMNQHLGWNGFGLAKAAKFFGNEKLFAMAYDQLSWIYGKNPYNASTVTEIGNNQPDLFKTGGAEFTPPTPPLTGGVMTGIGGTQEDDIALYPGWWWTTEYWAPTVSATVCLVNEIANN